MSFVSSTLKIHLHWQVLIRFVDLLLGLFIGPPCRPMRVISEIKAASWNHVCILIIHQCTANKTCEWITGLKMSILRSASIRPFSHSFKSGNLAHHHHHHHHIVFPKQAVTINSKHNQAARKSQDQQSWLPITGVLVSEYDQSW